MKTDFTQKFEDAFEDAKAKLQFTWVSDEWNEIEIFPQEDQKNLVALAMLAANILSDVKVADLQDLKYIETVERSLSLAINDLLEP